MRTIFFILFLGSQTGLCEGPQEIEAQATPVVEQKKWVSDIGLQLPFVTSHFSQTPYGLERKHSAPAYMVDGRLRVFLVDRGKFFRGVWGGGNLGFLPFSAAPIFGLGAGAFFEWDEFRWDVGTEGQFQSLIATAPFQNSPYDTTWISFLSRVSYDLTWFIPSFEFKLLAVPESKISQDENIDTVIGHKSSILISPEFYFKAPWGFLGLIDIDIFVLGATAIASKQFAFGIPSNTIVRYLVGLGWEIKDFEIWAKGAWVGNVQNEEEHFYQSPFMGPHYLLAQNVFTLEGRWHF